MKEIASPCVRRCCLNKEEICIGCFRSLSEILHWQGASDPQKIAILALAEARHKVQLSAQKKWQERV